MSLQIAEMECDTCESLRLAREPNGTLHICCDCQESQVPIRAGKKIPDQWF